jgi:hypothetical protein
VHVIIDTLYEIIDSGMTFHNYAPTVHFDACVIWLGKAVQSCNGVGSSPPVRIWDVIVMIVSPCSAPRCRIMYME